jgi:hypothetical protein
MISVTNLLLHHSIFPFHYLPSLLRLLYLTLCHLTASPFLSLPHPPLPSSLTQHKEMVYREWLDNIRPHALSVSVSLSASFFSFNFQHFLVTIEN